MTRSDALPGLASPRVIPATTALVIVDMQKDNLDPGAPMFKPEARNAIGPNQRALELARSTGMFVVFITHVHRPDGSDMGNFGARYPAIREGRALIEGTQGAEVCAELRPRPDELVIRKRRHSAFYGTDLDIILRSRRIEVVVVTGVATASCVLSTARDAFSHDYRTMVLADACAAGGYTDRGWGKWTGDEIHRAALTVMSANTGDVLTVDEFARLVSSAR